MIQPNRLTLLAAISLLSCCSVASAQKISVTISPGTIEAEVRGGASYTKTFSLVNGTGTRVRFRCSVADMWYDENNNRLSGRAGTHERSASLWVQFSPDEIIVEPHTTGTVDVLVTIPSTAAGSYYSVPVFEAIPADPVLPDAALANISTASATIGLRFNGLMVFTTLDTAEYTVEIMGGKITPPSESAELAMQLDVRNRSNAQVRVRGSFAILNSSGILAGRGSIEGQRYLPEQRKLLTTGWAGELAPGKYIAVVTLSYDRVGMESVTLLYELPLVVQ